LLRRKNHPGAKYDGPVSQAYQGVWLKPVLTDIEKKFLAKSFTESQLDLAWGWLREGMVILATQIHFQTSDMFTPRFISKLLICSLPDSFPTSDMFTL